MKAAIVEKPGVLVVRAVPEPVIGEYDALCRNLYASTCTGTDLHLLHGRFPNPIDYPTVLGHETVGRIVEVGPKVRTLRVGDLVTRSGTPPPPGTDIASNWGGYAEYGTVTDHLAMKEDGLEQSQWDPHTREQVVPPDVDPAVATMFITWRETLSYLRRMGVGDGASVLFLGSGGVGLSFAALCSHLGVSMLAMTGNQARSALAKAAGVTHFFDYESVMARDLAAVIADGFDFIVDTLGRKGLLDSVLPLLRSGGTVGVYGIDEINEVTVDANRARGTFTYYEGRYDESEVHDEIVALARGGELDATLWLDLEHPFTLDDINDAFQAITERRLVKALIRLAD